MPADKYSYFRFSKIGRSEGLDTSSQSLDVSIEQGAAFPGTEAPMPMNMYYTYADNEGVFIGAVPPPGNPSILIQGQSNTHIPIVFYPSKSKDLPTDLVPGELLLKNGETSKIYLDKQKYINLGSDSTKFKINVDKEHHYNLINSNIANNFIFSSAHRKIIGEVKRETKKERSPLTDLVRLVDDNYYLDHLEFVGMDPKSEVNNSPINSNKNPTFVENREVIYEFTVDSRVLDLKSESELYSGNLKPISSSIKKTANADRRLSRADTLSLSLTAPNYLMETVKGTVIDIFGNILDLNRYPIFTYDNNENNSNQQSDKSKKYLDIRAEERRSLAFHFEINARKDITGGLPDYNSNQNYGRDRSRFYVDIDKEGQFKINIPASSNSGNIPLLTRYENYSTISDRENPNRLIANKDNQDIVHDSFAASAVNWSVDYDAKMKPKIDASNGYNKGVITIVKNKAEISPIDRIPLNNSANASQNSSDNQLPPHIRYGTAYHDITATCISQQKIQISNYLYDQIDNWPKFFIPNSIDFPIVETEIEIGKNAGGRSGSINLDGFVDVNIGANNIDKQSMWLDTAGGIIANVGKDKNNVSAAINMDGQLFLNVGGYGIPGSKDSKAQKDNNSFTSGAIDIRVLLTSNTAVILRIDEQGISLVSPTRIFLQSNDGIFINSSSDIRIGSSNLYLNNRWVNPQTDAII